MNSKHTIITTLLIASMLLACKKKEITPAPVSPTTPTTTSTEGVLNFSNTIGSAGTDFNSFNFSNNGQDISWSLATDGNFIYVGDYGNNCVKKVDINTNTIVGWYGFQGNTWGYYTDYTTLPNPLFKPNRVLYKNNTLYAFSLKGGTGYTNVFKFSASNSSTVDTLQVISEYSFYAAAVDANENIYISKSDSLKIYTASGVTRFGGFGSADGKLNNSGVVVQIQSVNDTVVVIDPGNSRIQKFNISGNFLSKFAINTPFKDYQYLFIDNNKYYFIENYKLAEYTSSGIKIKEYSLEGSPANFGGHQKQFIVINNKVIFQDDYNSKLQIYTK